MSLPPDLPPFEPPVPPESSAPGTPQASPPSVAHAWISEPASATSKSQSRAGGLIVVVLVVVLAALIFVAVKLGGSALSSVDFSLADATQGLEASQPAAPAPEAAALTSVGEVVYYVGSDIQTGTYRLTEPFVGQDRWDACSFIIYSDDSQSEGAFLTDGLISGGRGIVTVEDGQFWTTYNCGEWEGVNVDSLFATPDDAAESFGMGAWLVGADIRPGAYTMVADFKPRDAEDFCFYSVTDSWAGGPDAIRENNFTDVRDKYSVQLETGGMMKSDGCGQWERIGD